MTKYLAIIFIYLGFFTLPALAQDSLDVTFRYYQGATAVRSFVPGEFNNFGPNSSGRINSDAVSLMSEDPINGFWFKTLRLPIDGGVSTYQGANGYRYKFHEHRNSTGSSYEWIADPLNPKVASEGFGDSWVEITHPLLFQIQPRNNAIFENVEPEIWASVSALNSDSIDVLNSKIYINGVLASTFEGFYETGRQLLHVSQISDLGVSLSNGTNRLKIEAVSLSGEIKTDSTQFTYLSDSVPVVAPRPAGLKDGITYGENGTSVTFSLYAPGKKSAFVIGDFTNWEVDVNFQMSKDSTAPDSVWFWKEVTELTAGQDYGFQYLVDNTLRIADPYSELVLHPNDDQFIPESVFPNLKEYPAGQSDYVGVISPGKTPYVWEATDYVRPPQDELVVYELLIRDFFEQPSYTNLIDTLDYLQNLGINAIELMPVSEFDGNLSWGYNPNFHFALDKYYGSPNEFKRFVDEAHKRGIAVILDVVYNHASGQNALVRLWNNGGYSGPTSDNPYFNVTATHPFSVFNDMNHESPVTRRYIKRANEFWMKEYNVDGFRYDLSKGFTQKNTGGDVGAWSAYDQSRVDILNDYADALWSYDPDAYVILEHLGVNSEEKVLADYGMMLWGKMTDPYTEASMGYHDNGKSNLVGVLSSSRNFNDKHLVGYMESHDEQWMMFKLRSFGNSSGSYDIKNLNTALERQKLAGAFFFTLPGPKMLWQFGELGYGFGNAGEQCLRESPDCPAIAPGRTSAKPIRWDYYDVPERKALYNAWGNLIRLRKASPAFTSPTQTFYSLGGVIKNVRFVHTDTDVVMIGNFGVTSTTQNVEFTQAGTWYDYFGKSQISIEGTQSSIDLAPGEFKIFTTKNFSDLISVSNSEDVIGNGPKQFKLNQNYPNPFNPSTNISFDIAKNGSVTLEVFNMLGQKVATLVNEQKAVGTYTVNFDASNLGSGVYLTRLTAGGTVQVKKMTLIK